MDNDYLYWQGVDPDDSDDIPPRPPGWEPEPDADPVALKAYLEELDRDSKATLARIAPDLEEQTAIYEANDANALAALESDPE